MHATVSSFVAIDFKSTLFNKSLRDFIMEEKTKGGYQLFHSVDESCQGGHSLHYREEDERAASMLANGSLLPKLYYLCGLNHTLADAAICKAEVNKWFTSVAVALVANCHWNPIKRCVENGAEATLNGLEEDDPLVKRYHVMLDPEARKRLGVVDLAEVVPAPGGDTATTYTASTVHTMRKQKGTKNCQVNNNVDSISTYGPQPKKQKVQEPDSSIIVGSNGDTSTADSNNIAQGDSDGSNEEDIEEPNGDTASPPGKPKRDEDKDSSLDEEEDLYSRNDPSASKSQLTAALSTMDSLSIRQDQMEATMNNRFGTLEGQLMELLSLMKANPNKNNSTGEGRGHPPGEDK
jgi:hypothetical protein